MREIPLQPVPSQIVGVALGGQPCRLKVYQKRTGLFVDLYVQDQLVVAGALAREAVPLIREGYLGFVGDLAFFDTEKPRLDPFWTGLGGRWVLNYREAGE